MLIYSNIFIWGSKFLTICDIISIFKNFHHAKFEKKQITIDFNGNMGHLWDAITY